MKHQLSQLATLLLFVFPKLILAQATYYVAINGDNNDNGSQANPWQTIEYALGQLGTSDDLKIMGGTYFEKVELFESGTAIDPIVIEPFDSSPVIIDGSTNNSLDAIFGLFGPKYIHIRGIHFTNNIQNDAQGIIIEGDCDGMLIENCEFSQIHFSNDPNQIPSASENAQPIIVYGTENNAIENLIIRNNYLHDCRTGFSEGLAVNGNVNGFEVSDNLIHDISNIGIDIIGHEGTAASNDQARNGLILDNEVYNCKSPYAISAGIYVDGGKDLIIERNRVHNNQWGIEVGCENLGKTTSNVIVRNNLIYENDDAGIVIGGYNFPLESGKVINCKILHNTTYGNDKLAAGIGGVTGEVNITYTENCTLSNNIFYTTNSNKLAVYIDNVNSQNLILDYNLYYANFNINQLEFEDNGNAYQGFVNFQNGTNNEANGLNINPEFQDLINFNISSNSPAIDEGILDSDIGAFDFLKNDRIFGPLPDMGAYEFQCNNVLILGTGDYPLSGVYSATDTIILTGAILLEGNQVLFKTKVLQVLGMMVPSEGQTVEVEDSGCN